MNETNTRVPEPESVTLESAERVIDFWQQRAERAEAKVQELHIELQLVRMERDNCVTEHDNERKVAEVRLARIKVLRRQLITVTALVPEAEWLERVAEMMWHTCESCPILRVRCPGYLDDRTNGLCTVLTRQLKKKAAAIRKGQEREGESNEKE